MRVYLDDLRTPPDGWRLVRWPDEVIALLKTGDVIQISLDHDLGNDDRGTGYDVVTWIERAVVESGFAPPIIRVHSANTSARQRMEAVLLQSTDLQKEVGRQSNGWMQRMVAPSRFRNHRWSATR